jgi:putative membrane protein
MLHLLWIWLLSAIVLLLVAYLVPGFEIDGFGSALIAALVVGVLNVTLGLLLKILTIPITILTLGLFLLVINAFILWISSAVVPGFRIRGFWPALAGAIVLALVRLALRFLAIA